MRIAAILSRGLISWKILEFIHVPNHFPIVFLKLEFLSVSRILAKQTSSFGLQVSVYYHRTNGKNVSFLLFFFSRLVFFFFAFFSNGARDIRTNQL